MSGDQAFAKHSREVETGNELDELLKLVGSMRVVPFCVVIASISTLVMRAVPDIVGGSNTEQPRRVGHMTSILKPSFTEGSAK